MNAQTPGKLSKFQRYRAKKKASGLKEYRVWARDWDCPEFKAEMERAALELRGRKSEQEAIDFIEASMAEMLNEIPPY
jgi:Protein  of unknown function (DUF3018)